MVGTRVLQFAVLIESKMTKIVIFVRRFVTRSWTVVFIIVKSNAIEVAVGAVQMLVSMSFDVIAEQQLYILQFTVVHYHLNALRSVLGATTVFMRFFTIVTRTTPVHHAQF